MFEPNKRLCIFGPKGAIQIHYYYYYNYNIVTVIDYKCSNKMLILSLQHIPKAKGTRFHN